MVINIINGDAATAADDITSVSIGDNNIAISGNYTPPSGTGVTAGSWDTSTSTYTITPKKLTPIGTNLKSYTALLIPQDMTSKKFITVTLSNGNTYYYTPSGTDANLQSGKEHTYNITVKNGYMEVEALTGGQWTDSGLQNVTAKDIKTSYTATDLKPGDYYYSNGDTSDGGLRRIYTDGTGVGAGTVAPITGETVVGIVFWVGDPTKGKHNNGTDFADFGDPALKTEQPLCTHGLIVALQDASVSTAWQTTSTNVDSWTSSNTYGSIATGTGADDPLNKLRGYNNTQAIRAYNNDVGNGSPNLVLPVDAIGTWATNNPAPSSISGWYLPSPKELSLLCGKDVNNIWGNNSGGTGMRDIVNASLVNVGSSAAKIASTWYWSSSELDSLDAWFVGFADGYPYGGSKGNGISVRGVSAF